MAKGSKKGVQNDHFFGTFGIRMAKGVKKGGHFWTPFWTPYVSNSPLKCVSFDQKGVKKGSQKWSKRVQKLDIAIWGYPHPARLLKSQIWTCFIPFLNLKMAIWPRGPPNRSKGSIFQCLLGVVWKVTPNKHLNLTPFWPKWPFWTLFSPFWREHQGFLMSLLRQPISQLTSNHNLIT